MKYLTNLLSDEYLRWDHKKVIIKAPTGMGKTTFIVKTLLPYYQSRKKKVLILCNRRLLRQQYFYSLVAEFSTYDEMKKTVKVDTYQSLADSLANGVDAELLLYGYDVVCLDEFHYFYSDSDFNGFGTYALFQALMISGISKTMIFVSATAECMESFVKDYIPKSRRYIEGKNPEIDRCIANECLQICPYDYSAFVDYSYIKCVLIPDLESLALEMVKSPKKSILFLDDKEKAEKIKELMCQKGNVPAKEIKLLNADSLDAAENSALVEVMTLANRLPCKILITTSVLDNGVSIKDDEVENLAVITESQVSFLQMIGRVRVECGDKKIRLFLCPNKAEYYARREQQLKELLDLLTDSERKLRKNNWQIPLMRMAWEKPEDKLTKMYRKFLTLLPSNCDYFDRLQAEKVYAGFCGTRFAINQFAECKIGDMYKIEAEFHALARLDPLFVIYKQMSWLKKDKDELEILDSSYRASQEAELISELCKVKNFDLEALRELKKSINARYGKMLFPDIVFKGGSFSKAKFEEILTRYGLTLEVGECEGKNLYTVKTEE